MRADCRGGEGVIQIRQEQVSETSTHVTITGTGVADGPWQGWYDADIYAQPQHSHRIDVEATGHAFQVELDVAGEADASSMLFLDAGAAGHCVLGFDDDQPARVYVPAGGGHLRARFPDPGSVAVWASVPCRQGSRVSWKIGVDFGPTTLEVRKNHVRCGKRGLQTHRVLLTDDGVTQGRPDAVRVVVRRADGDVRRIGYSVANLGTQRAAP